METRRICAPIGERGKDPYTTGVCACSQARTHMYVEKALSIEPFQIIRKEKYFYKWVVLIGFLSKAKFSSREIKDGDESKQLRKERQNEQLKKRRRK